MRLCRQGVQKQFEVMRDALNKTGRPIVYAIDDWGVTNPWSYGIGVSPFCCVLPHDSVLEPTGPLCDLVFVSGTKGLRC